MGDAGRQGQLHDRIDVLLGLFASGFPQGAVDDFAIQVVAHRLHVAALLRPQQVARAPDLQVPHGDAETRAKLGKLPYGHQPLFRHLGKGLIPLEKQVCIPQPHAAAHPAPELVELGETHLIRVVDEDGIHVGHIQPVFDDGGA